MKKQAGFLALTAVVLIVLFGLMTAVMVHMFMSGAESSAHSRAGTEAINLANAGVEAGVLNLITTSTCSVSTTTGTLSTGTFTHTCAPYNTSSTLAVSITATNPPSGTRNITLSNASSFAPLGAINIGSETIYYNSKSGNVLNNVRRAQNGTTAQAAGIGTAVTQNQYVIW